MGAKRVGVWAQRWLELGRQEGWSVGQKRLEYGGHEGWSVNGKRVGVRAQRWLECGFLDVLSFWRQSVGVLGLRG